MELRAVGELLNQRINNDFTTACEVILACKGRVVVTGMGKSGHMRQQDCIPLQHWNPSILCTPWRSRPWGFRHDY